MKNNENLYKSRGTNVCRSKKNQEALVWAERKSNKNRETLVWGERKISENQETLVWVERTVGMKDGNRRKSKNSLGFL